MAVGKSFRTKKMKREKRREVEAKQPGGANTGKGASFLPEGLGAGRDDPLYFCFHFTRTYIWSTLLLELNIHIRYTSLSLSLSFAFVFSLSFSPSALFSFRSHAVGPK